MGRGFKGFDRNQSKRFNPWESFFAYTGGMQSVIVPHTALYKFEVWGASGGKNGGNGGYSIGYKKIIKGTTLYICVGGQGGSSGEGGTTWLSHCDGGYNGGGGGSAGVNAMAGGGGGATHIALVTGTLSEIGKTSFVDNSNGLIVAGGGAGGTDSWYNGYGGGGGGLSGNNGSGQGNYGNSGSGGTQISGASFGSGSGGSVLWREDVGTYFRQCAGGGGGGLYGGYGGSTNGISGSDGASYGGGGGSGYIGGTPETSYHGKLYTPVMYNASSSGNGKAKITLVG